MFFTKKITFLLLCLSTTLSFGNVAPEVPSDTLQPLPPATIAHHKPTQEKTHYTATIGAIVIAVAFILLGTAGIIYYSQQRGRFGMIALAGAIICLGIIIFFVGILTPRKHNQPIPYYPPRDNNQAAATPDSEPQQNTDSTNPQALVPRSLASFIYRPWEYQAS